MGRGAGITSGGGRTEGGGRRGRGRSWEAARGQVRPGGETHRKRGSEAPGRRAGRSVWPGQGLCVPPSRLRCKAAGVKSALSTRCVTLRGQDAVAGGGLRDNPGERGWSELGGETGSSGMKPSLWVCVRVQESSDSVSKC